MVCFGGIWGKFGQAIVTIYYVVAPNYPHWDYTSLIIAMESHHKR